MNEIRQNEEGIGPEAHRRKQWVKPAMRILSAGSAEFNVGAIDDGVDLS